MGSLIPPSVPLTRQRCPVLHQPETMGTLLCGHHLTFQRLAPSYCANVDLRVEPEDGGGVCFDTQPLPESINTLIKTEMPDTFANAGCCSPSSTAREGISSGKLK